MNFWNFAVCHPKAAVVLGVCVCASVVGIGIAYAWNKTSLIGTLSPSVYFNIGKEQNEQEADQAVLLEGQTEINN